MLLAGMLTIAFGTPWAFAKETAPPSEPQSPESHSSSETTPEPLPNVPKTVLSWETGAGRSYVIPALEVVGYLFLLNWYDRNYLDDKEVYRTDANTFWEHLTDGKWVVDDDNFSINQFLHPYGGTVYYGLARSAGLNFWESLLYTAAGSFLWELGGEIGAPSINDQITTTIGGTFFGEPLFRMASLLLEGARGKPGFWRELGAAVISPPTGFNRLLFGNRFDAVFPSRDPAIFMRFQVGGSVTSLFNTQIFSSDLKNNGVSADFSFAYGLPGKPSYSYTRPFDYFDFQFTAATANIFESIKTRGLLFGTDYAVRDTTRGLWGLYGNYDYISPQVFRVSTAALSLGTTWQTWLSRTVALQGTALGGLGYGAAGSVRITGDRDYHYGATPQGLLALRLILGDRAMFELTGREYYVTGVLSPEPNAWENIVRGDVPFTWRIYGRHGVALQYVVSHRDAHYPFIEIRDQTVGTVNMAYVYLGSTGFGAVEWR